MSQFGTPVGVARRHGVAVVSTLVLLMVAITLAVVASRAPGSPFHKADLNDGGIWVTNSVLGDVGRDNKPIKQLDLRINAADDGTRLDILQNQQAVVAVDTDSHRLTPVDPSSGRLKTDGSVTVASDNVSLGGDVVAVADEAGKVWATHVDVRQSVGSLSALDEAVSKPLTRTSEGARLVVSTAGDVVIASGTTDTVTTVPSAGLGFAEPVTSKLSPAPGSDITAVTTVGQQVVWLDKEGNVGFAGHTVHVGQGAQLQLPGAGADAVIVATQRDLLAVDLHDGSQQTLASVPTGTAMASPPIALAGCAWGLWSDAGRAYVKSKCDDAPLRELAPFTIAPDARLVYRMNRNALVVNDALNGPVWDVDGATAQKIADWKSLSPKKQEQQDADIDKDSDQKAPPVALPDKLGIRSGATTVLHVLDNDRGPKDSILSIESVKNDNPQLSVAVAPDQQSLLATVNQGVGDTVLGFSYTVTDGEHAGTAPGTVSLTVHGRHDQDSAQPELRVHYPKQPQIYPVAASGSVEIPVLSDWRDPTYGDPISVVVGSASVSKGVASVTPDGVIRYVAPSGAINKVVTITYKVRTSQRAPDASGKAMVQVFSGTRTAPPTAEPDVVAGEVGTPIVVQPLANDIPGADPLDADAAVTLAGSVHTQAGVVVRTDAESGTATVVGREPGSYTLEYRIRYGAAGNASSRIRVNVSPAGTSSDKPIPSPDTTAVYGRSPMTVDVLANDYDPKARLLSVTSATARDDDGQVEVTVIAGRWLRVRSTTGDFGNARTIDYTVSNGVAEANSTVSVSQMKAMRSAENGPDAEPDTATVRAGFSVEIPVLVNDSTPSGDPVGLVVNGAAKSAGTVALEGPGAAYLSGRTIRYVAPAKVATSTEARAYYVVQNTSDPAAPRATGVVTIHITPAPDEVTNPDQPPSPVDLEARVVAGAATTVRLASVGQDPDGDPVTITGIGDPDAPGGGIPNLGTITGFSADTLTYQAFPGEGGPDQVSFEVTDPFGRTSHGVLRVSVVSSFNPPPPVAVDDSIKADPTRSLAINVMSNDLIPIGVKPLIKPLVGVPAGVALAENVVTVEPKAYGRSLTVPYTLTNGLADSTAVLGIRFRKGFNNPPVAGTVVAKPNETADTVTAKVLPKVSDIDDGPDDVTLTRIDPIPGLAKPKIDGGSATLPVGALPTVWTYHVKDSRGAQAIGSIYVAGRSPEMPYLKPDSLVHLVAGETKTIDITDYVAIRRSDAEPYLTTDDQISLHPSSLFSGSPSTPTQQSIKVTAGSSAGPGGIAFQVSNNKNLGARNAVSTVLALPVVVTLPPADKNKDDKDKDEKEKKKDEEKPLGDPSLTCAGGPIQILSYNQPQGGVEIIGGLCIFTPLPGDTRDFGFDISVSKSVPNVSVAISGTKAVITATGATPGAQGALTIKVKDTHVSATVPFRIIQIGSPRMTAIPTILLKAGESATQDFAGFLVSELSAQNFHPTILSVTSADGGPTPTQKGTSITFTAPPDQHGSFTYTVVMSDDGSTNADRTASAEVTVTTTSRPLWPAGGAGLSVSDVSPQSNVVNLRWNPADPGGSAEDVTYTVHTSPGGETACGTTTACAVTNLANGREYSFYVVASNDVGDSDPSNTVSATPDQVPSAVTNLRVVREGDGTVTYQWERPEGDFSAVTKYLISGDGVSGYETLGSSAASPQKVVSGVTNGDRLTFTVRPVNDLGETRPGPESTIATAIASGRPQAPSIAGITGSNVAGGGTKAFHVSWNQVNANGRGSAWYQLVADGAPATCGGGVWISSLSCDVQVPNDGREHSYAVRAANDAGNPALANPALEGDATSHQSGLSAGRTAVAAGQPEAFSQVKLDATGRDNEVKLTFTVGASHGARGLVTCVNSSFTCSFDVGANGGTKTQSFTTSVANGSTAKVALQYCNGAQENAGLGTNPCVTSPGATVIPYGPIRGAQISANANDRTISVNASVQPSGRPVNMTIRSSSGGSHSCNGQSGGGTVSCQWSESGLDYATTYTYTLSATDASGSGRAQQTASAQARTADPPVSVTVRGGDLKVVSYGDPPCTHSPGCRVILVSTANFTSSVTCQITDGSYGPGGFLSWQQGANETDHHSPNVQQNGWVDVKCTDQQSHTAIGHGSW